MNLLRSAVHAVQDEGGWARVSHVGQQIRNKASFDARNYGFPRLSELVEASGIVEVERIGDNPKIIMVRLKGEAAASPAK